MLNAAELSARLTLRALPGLRERAIHRLIREHGSAAAALCAPGHLLELGAKMLPDAAIRGRVDDALRTIDTLGVTVIAADDARYPVRLRQRLRSGRPALLFALGDIRLLDDVGIAVVGSRMMSEYGRTVAEDFSRDLAHAGLSILSGLAHGIDAAAHTAALDVGGDTIAIVGNGIDVIYPHANRILRQRIIERGVVISQFLPGDRPAPWHFPERNMVMAALAEGVLVVEAGKRSGATITAHHAGDYGVDAMAIPGPIGRPSCIGSNQLIREGVACVTTVAEILEVMHRPGRPEVLAEQIARRTERGTEPRTVAREVVTATHSDAAESSGSRFNPNAPDIMAIQAALRGEVRHLDDVATITGLPVSAIVSTMLVLELAGMVRQHPGSRYELRNVGATPG